jgi:competence protein ComEC
MVSHAPTVTVPTPLQVFVPPRAGFFENVWRAPLVPVALAATAGIVLDRYMSIPLPVSLVATVACLAAWAATRIGRPSGLPLIYLAGAVVALAAAYHHFHREVYAGDDIGFFVTADPRPARVQGVLVEEPVIAWQPASDPLLSIPHADSTQAVLQVTRLQSHDAWLPVSGRARLTVAGHLQGLHIGDQVEVIGRLRAPHGPANPGEFDYASYLRDQRILAEIQVRKTPDGVARLAEGWVGSVGGWLAVIRGWGQRQLQAALPKEQSGVAMALLLGEGSTMTNAEWEKYIRTGVIHVLAISGQHLVVLALFLWWTLWVFRVRRRRGAWLVAGFLLFYALLTGGRPPIMRSAVAVCVACGGLILRRPSLPANSFALAWLVVALLSPTDVFNTGCQLSFLAVAVLYWGASRWVSADPLRHIPRGPILATGVTGAPLPADNMDAAAFAKLQAETRSPTLRFLLLWLVRPVAISYAVTLAIWLVVAPLVAARYHLVSPIGILLGPPLTLLTSIALLAGFLLLLAAAICWPLVPIFAWATRWSVAGCEFLVDACDQLPGSYWYVGTVPEWWLWIFYAVVLALLMLEGLQLRWRWLALAALGWICVGLLSGSSRVSNEELRCTFLAVGHGGCTVIEAPDGRTLIYDAGALSGPDVTRRQIAPFLWDRGIQRIDEVFLSHADLDHFNGLLALVERFTVGQVTCTPSFSDKTTPGVRHTLAVLTRHGIPIRITRAGDRLSAGGLEMDVLHPPAVGPEGNENARSLVLLLRHAGHSLLLTGDLEGPGLGRVLDLPPTRVDVLMAPHHGSKAANKPELAAWARPRVVISCQGPPRSPSREPDPYSVKGAQFLGTWPHGAITIRSQPNRLTVETFQTGQRLMVTPQ